MKPELLRKQQKDFMQKSMLVIAGLCFILTLFTVYAAVTQEIAFFRVGINVTLTVSLSVCFLLSTVERLEQLARFLFTAIVVLGTLVSMYVNGFFLTPIVGWCFITPLFIFVAVGTVEGISSLTILLLGLLGSLILDRFGVLTISTYDDLTVHDMAARHLPIMAAAFSFSVFRLLKLHSLNVETLGIMVDERDELIRHKDEFLANISHELRTPLNGIYGSLQGIKNNDPDSSLLLDAAMMSSENLNKIVSDLLDSQKFHSGEFHLDLSWISTSDYLDKIKALSEASLNGKNLRLEFVVASPLPRYILCDRVRLSQIINNVVSNAVKFTDTGNVKVTMSFDDVMHFRCEDSGIGMDEVGLRDLFTPFKQVDASNGRRFGGTGLGMSIVKQLVEAMHGTISVESNLGQGTVVAIDLPFEVREEIVPSPANAEPAIVIGPSLRILVVDDDATNRLVCASLLKRQFQSVTTAGSGEEALEILSQSNIDLVISDISMPGMDGIQFLQAAKRNHPQLPIIALTANASNDSGDRYLRNGFAALVTKPFTADELLEAVTGVVGAS